MRKFVSLQSVLSILLIAGILASGLAVIPTIPVLAQEGIDQALSKAFSAEQTWLSKQQTAIDKCGALSSKVQELINTAAAQGLDVSSLEDALATFQNSMSSVYSEHQNAANIISGHNGFDASGNISDRQSARETVMNTRRALGNAHMTMTQASWALRDALNAWKNLNFPQ